MKKRHWAVRRAAGFSLVEMLVILLVAMILMLLSFPEISKYFIRSHLEGITRETGVFVQRMRFEAIRTGQPARVCMVDRQVVASADLGARVLSQVDLHGTLNFGCNGVVAGDPTELDGDCFVLLPDGSAAESGFLRFSDVRGNCLEVRVEPQATARVQIRKWDDVDGRFYARNEGGKAWTWRTERLF